MTVTTRVCVTPLEETYRGTEVSGVTTKTLGSLGTIQTVPYLGYHKPTSLTGEVSMTFIFCDVPIIIKIFLRSKPPTFSSTIAWYCLSQHICLRTRLNYWWLVCTPAPCSSCRQPYSDLFNALIPVEKQATTLLVQLCQKREVSRSRSRWLIGLLSNFVSNDGQIIRKNISTLLKVWQSSV